MIEPQDMTGMFNTPLSPADEARFQQWARSAGRQRDTYDYDLRGAWAADAQAAANGHLPDTWKKPNHPTFSTESMYNGVEGMHGGRWVQNGGRWQFFAGPTNRSNFSDDELRSYFSSREPDAHLILPPMGVAGFGMRAGAGR